MLRSFQRLASEPGAPVKQQATNAKDAVAWLQSAQVKLTDCVLTEGGHWGLLALGTSQIKAESQ